MYSSIYILFFFSMYYLVQYTYYKYVKQSTYIKFEYIKRRTYIKFEYLLRVILSFQFCKFFDFLL